MLSVSSFGLLSQPNTQVQSHKPTSKGAAMGGFCLLLGGFSNKAQCQTSSRLHPIPAEPCQGGAAATNPAYTDQRLGGIAASLWSDGRRDEAATTMLGSQRAFGDDYYIGTARLGGLDEGGNRKNARYAISGTTNDNLTGNELNIVNNCIDQSRSRERHKLRLRKRRA